MIKELNGADAANVLMLYENLNKRYLELTHQVAAALKYLEPPKLPCDCINKDTLVVSCDCNNYDDYAEVRGCVNDIIRYRHVYNIFYPNSKEKEN